MKKAIRRLKRNVAVIAVFCMVFSLVPVNSYALETSDISNHWAKAKIQSWMDQGLIKGYKDGTFKPDNNITRAEFMSLVNGAFRFMESAEINYSDVDANAWYKTAVATAKAANYISGYPDNTIRPNNPISRAEAASIIMKINYLEAGSFGSYKFTDESRFGWSKDAVNAVSAANIMNGYPDGSFRPQEFIKRAEAVAALDKALTYSEKNVTYSKAGTYGPAIGVSETDGNVTIAEKDIILQNTIINGNLIIGKNVGDGNVTLKNVTVKGETKIYGGGQNSIIVIDSTLGKVSVSKENGKIRIVVSGKTKVELVQANSGVKLEENNLKGSGGFQEIILDAGENDEIVLTGSFDKVTVESEGLKIQTPKGTTIDTLIFNKKGKVQGTGAINTAYVNSSGVTFDTAPKKINVAPGVSEPTIGSETVGSGSGGGGSGGGSGSGGGGGNNLVKNAATPVIITDLTNQTIMVGKSMTLNATATVDDGGTISYEWYSNTTASATGGIALGIATATFAPSTDTAGIYYYYCVITNTNSSATGAKTATVTSAVSKVTVAQQLSSDATLSDLTVSGTAVAGFAAGILTYNVELAAGTTVVPTVAATVTDPEANAVVTAAGSLPGTTTVVVTAEDGTTQTYTIYFTVALPREITGFTELPALALTADENLVDLTALLASGKLPTTVTITDGTTPTTAAIAGWTGPFNGTVIGTTTLAAVWTIPAGYADITAPVSVTLTVNVTTAQTAKVIFSIPRSRGNYYSDHGYSNDTIYEIMTALWGTQTTTIAGVYLKPIFSTSNNGSVLTINANNITQSLLDWLEHDLETNGNISIGMSFSGGLGTAANDNNIINGTGGTRLFRLYVNSADWEGTTVRVNLHDLISGVNAGSVNTTSGTVSPYEEIQNGVKANFEVVTIGELVPVTSVTITNPDMAITNDGGTVQMNAEVLPIEAYDKTIRWSVENSPGVTAAAISNLGEYTGVLFALKNGTVKVYATSADTGVMSEPVTVTISGQVEPEAPTGISNTGEKTVPAGLTTAAPAIVPDQGRTSSIVARDPGDTGGTEASFDASTNTFSGSIDYYTADESVGRTEAGNYVGVRITAPSDVTVDKENATFTFTNASGTQTLTGSRWLDGDNYVYYYPLVTTSNQEFTVVIDWDGVGTTYAPETIVIKISGAALKSR